MPAISLKSSDADFQQTILYPDLICIWIGPELLKTLGVENKIKGGFNVRRQAG